MKNITIVPSRDEISLKSLIKSKQSSSKSDDTPAAAPGKPVKPKARAKGTKTGMKDLELDGDVYAPGFRLRSKKTEVVNTKPERILKEVKYSGMEPKVKLPWPVGFVYATVWFTFHKFICTFWYGDSRLSNCSNSPIIKATLTYIHASQRF